jgi:hypothetical protein
MGATVSGGEPKEAHLTGALDDLVDRERRREMKFRQYST